MSVFLFFIDGVGLGPAGPGNPFTKARMPFLESALGSRLLLEEVRPSGKQAGSVRVTDAQLGVGGYPQSATGQTALLTGGNAPLLAGRHVPGRPSRKLKNLILEENILCKAKYGGHSVAFLNAYRPEALEAISRGTYKASVTTIAALSAGLTLKDFDDLREDRALYHDMTHESLDSHYGIPKRTPAEAGRIARNLAEGMDFCLYEFFLTDVAGHRQDHSMAQRHLEAIDSFVEALGPDENLCLIIASDHGNMEDLHSKGHTLNPVPTVILGGKPCVRKHFENIERITDIAPAISLSLENQGKVAD